MMQVGDYSDNQFEAIKHLTEGGIEFWFARDLQIVLEYTQWQNFVLVIEKAKTACETSGNDVTDHFADASRMVKVGSGAQRHSLLCGQKSQADHNRAWATMPEDLPTPKMSIKRLYRDLGKSLPKQE